MSLDHDIYNGVELEKFVCSKEGFRNKKYLKREYRIQAPSDETRVGCKAMIYVSKKDNDKWLISILIKNHTHKFVILKSAQFLRVHKKKTRVQRNLIDVLDDLGIRSSKIMLVLATELGGMDTSKNPGFFYAIQMDAEGQLANCFWADFRSRMTYKYFGDVVAFDPTYLINKYKMPFVPFTGVNHHYQSILFGCVLLWDETKETFVWLLNTWLEAMFGYHPKTIITDQDAAITNVVAKRSESMNKYFKDYVNSSTLMSKFVIQYKKALDARYNKNREKIFKSINSKSILKTFYPMKKEALEYVTKKITVNEQVFRYRVHEFDKEKPEYIVTFVSLSATTTCSCHMFEFVGILCRHQLTILIKKMHSLPDQYVLKWWTRDAKKGEVESILDEQHDSAPKSSMILFNNVIIHSMELSKKASRFQKHYDMAIEGLQRLFEELDAFKISEEEKSSSAGV
ncbi:protein FAR1-RELATED SEQUENCE 5-like [Durio zibethinus]|uniref:Protein FAR1-RELATED SEQUENCE n=1 Tax=Durio zibethinus TaxID=66656 RepID=A0A6P5ZDR8_DURZI|nr:protein FAR1-RELATED SEQUENCE 5-like [Durio zibethinus]